VYTWANPAGIKFFGEDVIGHKADDYFIGEQKVYKTVKNLFDGDENTVYIESWQRRYDGEKRLLAWWCRVLKDENGNVIGAISTARDITETRLADEQIRELNLELVQRVARGTHELSEAQDKIVRQEKFAVLGQLAGGVGHELRNPLGVITNAVYYLKMLQPEMDVKVKQYLEMIESETRTAEKIITDLLEFARVKSVVKEKVSVSDLIEYTLSRRTAPFNISVIKDMPADLPHVSVDPRQICQILENLVVNAFQAMPDGGALNIHGKLEVRDGRNYVSLALRDSGTGISIENMSKLFEPLFTTKPKGIGLGLAVCQKLIEANEGRIEVQSEEGKGTVFTIHLPAVAS
jgi:PAS domain S-box-containing protein